MPKTDVVFYMDDDGYCPYIEWVESLQDDAVEELVAAVELLEAEGYDLRRPYADFLRDGIHELRIKFFRINYRALYFIYGRTIAVITSGLAKEGKVPDKDIDEAIRRMNRFKQNPERHTYQEPMDDD